MPATTLRAELRGDLDAIDGVVRRAFEEHPFSDQTEHSIVRALREAGALTLSLVAERAALVVGHVAFSPVSLADDHRDWFGLGPLAVEPALHRQGIGSQLVEAGLRALRERGAAGCVVVGDAAYYERFGFRAVAGLVHPGLPPEHLLALSFGAAAASDAMPQGEVTYHAAFAAGG